MTENEHTRCAADWIHSARAEWRDLTGGPDTPDALRPTLVGVSGGNDSAALAIALATLDRPRVVLAQVLHDQRPAELVHDDRVAVECLAGKLGVRLVTTHARSQPGNAEHAARETRYAALDQIAARHGCRFIATAHHTFDQAETLIMAMCRGGSADALRGVRRSRPSRLNTDITIIRPALTLSPTAAACVCREYGYAARIDATNRDPARARARVRQEVIPSLDRTTPKLGAMLAATIARLETRLGPLPAEKHADIGFERIKA